MSDNQYMNDMREATNNAIDWLIDEAEREQRLEIIQRMHEAEMKLENIKWKAIADMYEAIEKAEYSAHKICVAEGKVHTCFILGFINQKTYKNITSFLRRKELVERDYKKMYRELLKLRNSENEPSEFSELEWEEV